MPPPACIKQYPGSPKHVHALLIRLVGLPLIVSIKEYLPMNSYRQIPQLSIQNACTCIQPVSSGGYAKAQITWERGKVGWGETDSDLTLLALNEPERYRNGQPAESAWDASHLQATGMEAAFTHITIQYLPDGLQSSPLLKQKSSPVSDLTGSSRDHCSHPVWPLGASALWSDSHESDFPFLFLTGPVCFLLLVNI